MHVQHLPVCLQAFLGLFCGIFAVNSAVHSYLVLRYTDGDKVAVNVGFYYMSNAAGRLTGTVLSGVLYSYAGATRAEGFGWCFILSAVFVILCTAITTAIHDDAAGLACGSWTCVRGVAEPSTPGDRDAGGAAAPPPPAAIEMEPMHENGDARWVARAAAGAAAVSRGSRSWGDDRRVDEVRKRDSGVFPADERRKVLPISPDSGRAAEAGVIAREEREGRFGRVGNLSYPGVGPPVRPLRARNILRLTLAHCAHSGRVQNAAP